MSEINVSESVTRIFTKAQFTKNRHRKYIKSLKECYEKVRGFT